MQDEFSDFNVWLFEFSNLLKTFEVPETLELAIISLSDVGVNIQELQLVIEEERPLMRQKLNEHSLKVPEDHALAIHIYTIEKPSVYAAVKREMCSSDRSTEDNKPSKGLFACMPFVKYLDVALHCLPEMFRFKGRVYRGVKWVFPSPKNHDPERYFFAGRILYFFEFKSSSKNHAMMYHEAFCGKFGARSIFTIDATEGFDIAFFSKFVREAEVLFRPTSFFRVLTCSKQNDPLLDQDKSGGFPDNIVMQQLSGGIDYSAVAKASAALASDVKATTTASEETASEGAAGRASGALSAGQREVEEWVELHMASLLDSPSRRSFTENLFRHNVLSVGILELLTKEDVDKMGLGVGLSRGLVSALKLQQPPPPPPDVSAFTPPAFATPLRRCALAIQGHSMEVNCLSWSGDGSALASGGDGGELRVWTGEGFRDCSVLRVYTKGNKVLCVAFHPGGKILASASWGGSVQIWGGAGYKECLSSLSSEGWLANCVVWGVDGGVLASGWNDGKVRLWSGNHWQTLMATLRGHNGAVWALAVSEDGWRLASGSQDKMVQVWEGDDFNERLAMLEGHTAAVWSVCWSLESSLLASGSQDMSVRLWRVQGAQTCLAVLREHTGFVKSVAFSRCGEWLASGSRDRTIRVWGGRGFQTCVGTLTGHSSTVSCLAWAAGRLASASDDRTVKVWEA